MASTDVPACPMDATRDDRKSAALAAGRVHAMAGARLAHGFEESRAVLRSGQLLQGGEGAEATKMMGGEQYASVFFKDGEPHKKQRQRIQRFFTPKAISTRHRLVMERTSDELLAGLRAAGGGKVDELSYQLAVAVAAEIIGLTNSDRAGLARRIQGTLLGLRVREFSPAVRFVAQFATIGNMLHFYARDVRPAIKARRKEPREDVISHLIEEGYPNRAILIECMTYGVAGMVTTREFIVMAAWHMFDNDALRDRFLASDEAGQTALLEEILRLEPVAAMLHRKAAGDCEVGPETAKSGDVFAVNIREANIDPAAVGECPLTLDPDRAKKQKTVGSFMSFGDGSHRCPGSQVAIAETRVFLDRLMRLPDLRLVHAPEMTWSDGVMSYELRNAEVTCAKS